MKIKYSAILFGIVLITTGCFSYKSYVPLDLNKLKLEIPLSITKITIEDRRTEISEEDDIKIPFMSGLKNKSWEHHPKLTEEHKQLIESTIQQNFKVNSKDTAEIYVAINYACKEFEQTGKSEIERIYLNTETILTFEYAEYQSSIFDTFYFESIDASNKHFEKFFQTSLQNNITRNIICLRDQFYNSFEKETECFNNSFSKEKNISKNLVLNITGKEDINSINTKSELEIEITQEWKFKISTNENGKLVYIESLVEHGNKKEELSNILKYLNQLQIIKTENENLQTYNCWTLIIKNHEH